MEKKLLLGVMIPESFEPVFVKFNKLIDKDKEFIFYMESAPARYKKKTKQNFFFSAKVRFLMAKYLKENIKKEKHETTKDNADEESNP